MAENRPLEMAASHPLSRGGAQLGAMHVPFGIIAFSD